MVKISQILGLGMFIVFFAFMGKAGAVPVEFAASEIFISPHLHVYEDVASRLTVKNFINGDADNLLQATEQQIPSFQFSLSPIWAKIQINNSSTQAEKAFFEHRYVHTDHVTIFSRTEGDIFSGWRLGDRVSARNQWKPYRFPRFPIVLEPGLNTFYYQVQSEEATTMPLFLLPAKSRNHDPQFFTWLSLFGVSIVALFLLWSVYAVTLKIVFLWYSLFVSLFIFNHFLIEGLANQLLPFINWSYMMNEGYFLTALSYQVFLILATWKILDWKNRSRLARSGIYLVSVTSLLIMLSIFVVPYRFVVIPYFGNAFLIICAFFVIMVPQVFEGHRKALVYGLSWLVGGVISALSAWKFVDSTYIHSFGFLFAGVFHIVICVGMMIYYEVLTPHKRVQSVG